jgi:uncharacterized protein
VFATIAHANRRRSPINNVARTALISLAAVLASVALLVAPALAAQPDGAWMATFPWWVWPLLLFVVTFFLGIVAVIAGIGGGVLFVPIVGGFFPFHLDFVRGAGLMIALAGALSAGPGLLRTGMASLRLTMPLALVGSASSILGAVVGLALPDRAVQTGLGVTILAIVVLMWLSKRSEHPEVPVADPLSAALRISGAFYDGGARQEIAWQVHRTPLGLAVFAGIGILGGLFGLGAGWASVPALNLLMGAPLKVAVATSSFMLSIVSSSAAWVYLNQGAVLPIITVPSIIGIMLGARVGVRLLTRIPASTIRIVIIVLLLVSGLRALLKGLGIWN